MKQLAQKVNEDKDFCREAYSYIKNQLDIETAKPLRKRDFNKIAELTAYLSELRGDEPQDNSEGINKLYEHIAEYEKSGEKPTKSVRKIIPVIVAAAIIAAMNCISVLAWDMNIFSAVIEFSKGGFSVDFGKSDFETIEIPTSADDPYGIIAECAKYDVYPETPHYLPDGFYLEYTSNNVNENFANIVHFTFRNGKMSIGFTFKRYWNEVGQIGIPSDHYNISETTVNGKPAIISREDNQYTIAFINDKTSFLMFTQNVPYDECEKIVKSIRPFLPVSEDDPYGIIAECAKYEIYPDVPHYLPDGFKLVNTDCNVDKNDANTINFIYKKGKQSIQISFDRYWNEVSQIGIPSDKYNISETKVNGLPAIVSKEDNQYTITFIRDKTVFFMFTQNVPYDECEKIVKSIRPFLPVSEDDPYGIIAECAKYEIYPETPHYLPEGFNLEHTNSNSTDDFANTVRFVFKNKNQSISISFDRYWNNVAKIGIPSDHYNVSEIKVNGHDAIVSKEDNQYTITYNNGDTVFFMFTQDVPYDECEKIVASIK